MATDQRQVARGVKNAALALVAALALAAVGVTLYLWLRPEVYEGGVSVSGDTLEDRVRSAIAEVNERYRYFDIKVEQLGDDSIAMRVGWINPHLRGKSNKAIDKYVRTVKARVEDSREATILLLKVLAQSNPQLHRFSAFEDHVIVPVWSRRQILNLSAPARYRKFTRYTHLQHAAQEQAGLADPTQREEKATSDL